MKNIVKTVAVVGAGMALMAPAAAEYSKPMDISIRAGIYFAKGAAEAAEGRNWFTAGIEYKLRDLKAGDRPDYSAAYSISLDVYGKGSFSAAPLLINYVGRTPSFYYSAGAGVAFTHFREGTGSDSSLQFGYQLSIGKDFVRGNMPLFAEIKFFGNGKAALSSFAIVGGVRF